jgi:hypothetical protein
MGGRPSFYNFLKREKSNQLKIIIKLFLLLVINWSAFDLSTSTRFMRLGARPEEVNGLLDVINQLEANMENSEEVRNTIASTHFVATLDPLEGKLWDYLDPTNIQKLHSKMIE